jgi:hypothetical protein
MQEPQAQAEPVVSPLTREDLIYKIIATALFVTGTVPDGLAERVGSLSAEGLQAILSSLEVRARDKEASEVRDILGSIIPSEPQAVRHTPTIQRSGDGYIVSDGVTENHMSGRHAEQWAKIHRFILPEGEDEVALEKLPEEVAAEPDPVQADPAQAAAEPGGAPE